MVNYGTELNLMLTSTPIPMVISISDEFDYTISIFFHSVKLSALDQRSIDP